MRVEERVGKSSKRSARRLCKKRQVRNERGGSKVYDIREEKSVMGACLHYPRRGVNKYMHKREIDARLGEIGWKRGKKLSQGFVHGVAGSYTNYRKLWRKGRGWKSECAVSLKVYQQPVVIVI